MYVINDESQRFRPVVSATAENKEGIPSLFCGYCVWCTVYDDIACA